MLVSRPTPFFGEKGDNETVEVSTSRSGRMWSYFLSGNREPLGKMLAALPGDVYRERADNRAQSRIYARFRNDAGTTRWNCTVEHRIFWPWQSPCCSAPGWTGRLRKRPPRSSDHYMKELWEYPRWDFRNHCQS